VIENVQDITRSYILPTNDDEVAAPGSANITLSGKDTPTAATTIQRVGTNIDFCGGTTAPASCVQHNVNDRVHRENARHAALRRGRPDDRLHRTDQLLVNQRAQKAPRRIRRHVNGGSDRTRVTPRAPVRGGTMDAPRSHVDPVEAFSQAHRLGSHHSC
jgi:hypothetical protein